MRTPFLDGILFFMPLHIVMSLCLTDSNSFSCAEHLISTEKKNGHERNRIRDWINVVIVLFKFNTPKRSNFEEMKFDILQLAFRIS